MVPTDRHLIYRHKLPTRLWHWLNAACLYVLFTSGLGIFNAHPYLYWGEYGANFDPIWFAPGRFPGWLTLPEQYSLAMSRRWHLFAAPIFAFSLLAYMLWSLFGGHFRRDLAIGRREFTMAHIWHDIKEHARLRLPRGEAAKRYNLLQKIAYSKLLFLFLPVLILTGLAMSPGMDAAWPWLTQMWGGRQSARSIHFIAAWATAIFFLVHIAMVLLAGPFNEVRSMITGWFIVPQEKPGKEMGQAYEEDKA